MVRKREPVNIRQIAVICSGDGVDCFNEPSRPRDLTYLLRRLLHPAGQEQKLLLLQAHRERKQDKYLLWRSGHFPIRNAELRGCITRGSRFMRCDARRRTALTIAIAFRGSPRYPATISLMVRSCGVVFTLFAAVMSSARTLVPLCPR